MSTSLGSSRIGHDVASVKEKREADALVLDRLRVEFACVCGWTELGELTPYGCRY